MATTPTRPPLVWDYDLDEDQFRRLLSGDLTLGPLDRTWTAVRLLRGPQAGIRLPGAWLPEHHFGTPTTDHEWAHAVTEHDGFGRWTWGVSRSRSDLQDGIRATAH